MHLFKEKGEEKKKTACLGGVTWGKPVPDFIRKSILFFFGAVGYFIKKPFNSILKKKKKRKKNVIEAGSASLSWMCNLSDIPSSSHLFVLHLHRSALIFLFKLVSLVITSRATRRSAVLFECENASALIWSIFSLHVVTKRKKKRKKKKPVPFVHTPVNCFKYLSLFLGGGGEGARTDEEKPYTSVSSSGGLDAYRVFLVTFISAAYITEQQQQK